MDVFMSYRRVGGSGWANFLYSELTRRGIEVFLDREKMGNGKFSTQITQNIINAPNFLLLLTPGALDKCSPENYKSDWMRKEIGTAITNKKNIIPVCLEGFDINEIPASETTQIKHLKELQVVYFNDTSQENIEAGIQKIINMMGKYVIHVL